MDQPRRPVHILLKRTVEMRVGFGRGSETHLLAKVVSTITAFGARAAEAACFDSHPVAHGKRGSSRDIGSESHDLSGRFVAETHRVLKCKVSIASMEVIVQVGSAEPSGSNTDLNFVSGRCGIGTFFNAEVLGSVEDGRGVCAKRGGGGVGGRAVHDAVLLDDGCRHAGGFCDGDGGHRC